MATLKSIDDLTKASSIAGTEKIPISGTEYVDLAQVKEYAAPDVDATPTENSDNAVSSGGVYDALQNIDVETVTTSGDITSGNRVIAEGDIKTNDGNVFTSDGNIYTSGGDIYSTEGDIYAVDGDFVAREGSYYKGSGDDKVEVAYKNELFSGDYDDLTNQPTIPDISNLATESYVDEAIAEIPTPDVSGQISSHNTSTTAHADIRGEIDSKVDAVSGMGLSSNDYTSTEKSKLAGIAEGANKTLFDTTPTADSTNAVTSGGVKSAIETAMQDAGSIGSKDPIELDTDLQIVADKANKDFQGNVIHTTYVPLTDMIYASETVKGMARIWVTTEDGESVLNIATEDE